MDLSPLFDAIERGDEGSPSKARAVLDVARRRGSGVGDVVAQPFQRATPRDEPGDGPTTRYGEPIQITDVPTPDLAPLYRDVETQDDYEKARSAQIRKERLQKQGTRWYDYPLAAVEGAGSLIEGAGSLADYVTRGYDPVFAPSFKAVGKDIQSAAKSLQTEAYRYVQEEENFWDWNRPGAKITGMVFGAAPSLIASGLIGGPLAGVAGRLATRVAPQAGARFAAGMGPGMVGAGGAGALMNAGDLANQIEQDVMQAPEQTLRDASPLYRNLREQGRSDQDARMEVVRASQGIKPLIAGAVGGLSAFGMDAAAANWMVGKLATMSVMKGARTGLFKEASQEFVENASNEYLAQQAKIQNGLQKEIDWGGVWSSGAQGAIVGGIIGGATGAYFRESHGPQVVPSNNQSPTITAALPAPNVPTAPGGGLPPPGGVTMGGSPFGPGGTINQGAGPQPAMLAPPGPPEPEVVDLRRAMEPPRAASDLSQRPTEGPVVEQPAPPAPDNPEYRVGLQRLLDASSGGPSGDFEGPPGTAPGAVRGDPRNEQFMEQIARGAWAEAGGDAAKFREIIRREAQRIQDSLGEPELYRQQRINEDRQLLQRQIEAEQTKAATSEQERQATAQERERAAVAARPPSAQETAAIRKALSDVTAALEERGVTPDDAMLGDINRHLQQAARQAATEGGWNRMRQAVNEAVLAYTPAAQEQAQEQAAPEAVQEPAAQEQPPAPPVEKAPSKPRERPVNVKVAVEKSIRRQLRKRHDEAARVGGRMRVPGHAPAPLPAAPAPVYEIGPRKAKWPSGEELGPKLGRAPLRKVEGGAPYGIHRILGMLANRGVNVTKEMLRNIDRAHGAISDLADTNLTAYKFKIKDIAQQVYDQAQADLRPVNLPAKKEEAAGPKLPTKEEREALPHAEAVAAEHAISSDIREQQKRTAEQRAEQRAALSETAADLQDMTWPELMAHANKLIDDADEQRRASKEAPVRPMPGLKPSKVPFVAPENWPDNVRRLVALIQKAGGHVDLEWARVIRDAFERATKGFVEKYYPYAASQDIFKKKSIAELEAQGRKEKLEGGLQRTTLWRGLIQSNLSNFREQMNRLAERSPAQIDPQRLMEEYDRVIHTFIQQFAQMPGQREVALHEYQKTQADKKAQREGEKARAERAEQAKLIRMWLKRPSTADVINHYKLRLQNDFADMFLDDEGVRAEDIVRAVDEEMKAWRQQIKRAVDRQGLPRAERAPMRDVRSQIDDSIMRRILAIKEENRTLNITAGENERMHKLDMTVEPEQAWQHEEKDTIQAELEKISDEVGRQISGERGGALKGKTAEAIAEQSDRTFWRDVEKALAETNPPEWAQEAQRLRNKRDDLPRTPAGDRQRAFVRRQLEVLRYIRARDLMKLENALRNAMPKAGEQPGQQRLSFREGIASWLKKAGYDIKTPSPVQFQITEKKGTPEAKRIGELLKMKATPTATEAKQAEVRLQRENSSPQQRFELDKKERDVIWSVMSLHKPANWKRAITGEVTTSLTPTGRQRRETRVVKRGGLAETDAQATARWAKIIEQATAALKAEGLTNKIPKRFSLTNTLEMNTLVLMQRALKMQPSETLAPTPLSNFVQNVRGWEALFHAVHDATDNPALQAQVRGEFADQFSNTMDQFQRLQPKGVSDETWANYQERMQAANEWANTAETLRVEGDLARAAIADLNKIDFVMSANKEGVMNNRERLLHETLQQPGTVTWKKPRENQIIVYRKKGERTVLPTHDPRMEAWENRFRTYFNQQQDWAAEQQRMLAEATARYEAGRAEQRKSALARARQIQQRRADVRAAFEMADRLAAHRAEQQNVARSLGVDKLMGLSPSDTDAMLAGVLDYDPQTAGPAPLKEGSYRADDLLNRALRQTKNMFSGFAGSMGKGVRFIRRAIANRLSTIVGDMEVEVTSSPLYGPNGEPAIALFEMSADGRPRIRINSRFNLLPASLQAHLLQHEMSHGALSTAYKMNLNGARSIMDMLYAQALNSPIGSDPRFTYAMRNAKEFMSEVHGNAALQSAMYGMSSPGPKGAPQKMNMFRRFVQAMQNIFGVAFGGRPAENYLTYVLAQTDDVMQGVNQQMAGDITAQMKAALASTPLAGTASDEDPLGVDPMLSSAVDNALGAIKARAGEASAYLGMAGRWDRTKAWALGAMTSMELGRNAKRGGLFTKADGSDPFEKLIRVWQDAAPLAIKLQTSGNKLAHDLKKHLGNFAREAGTLANTLYNSTLNGYDPRYDLNHPANSHLTQQTPQGTWQTPGNMQARRASHAQDHAAWLALSPTSKAVGERLINHYVQMQHAMSAVLVRNVVDAGIANGSIATPPSMNRQEFMQHALSGNILKRQSAKTVREQQLDAALGSTAHQALSEIARMSMSEGVYLPLTRSGDWVVRGHLKAPTPDTAHTRDDQRYIFQNEADAEAYALKLQRAGIQSRMTGTKWNNADAYQVTPITHHVEFFDSLEEANQAHAEYKASGDFERLVPAEHRNKIPITTEIRPAHIQAMHNAIAQNDEFSTSTRAVLAQLIDEMQMRAMSGYRIQKHRTRRRNIRGFNKSLLEPLVSYNASMSRYLSDMLNAPKIADLENQVQDIIKERASQGDENHRRRVRLRDELQQRMKNSTAPGAEWVNSVKTFSYMTWLFGPSAMIINGTQVGMVTAPVLWGKGYSAPAIVKALTKAYRTIGLGKEIKSLWTDHLAEAADWEGDTAAVDPVGRIIDRVPEYFKAVLRAAQDAGKLDRFSGIEFDQLSAELTKGKMALNYAARLATVGPRIVEAINRSVTLMATYELGRNSGMSHEQAIAHAIDITDDTQIDMSQRGTGRWFNNPWFAMPLQFKKYGAKMTEILARSFINMVSKDATPAQKKEARRTLLAMALVTATMAGAAGLPWEPAKAMVTAAWALGLSDDWDTLESSMQKKIAEIMGNAPAEVVMRGIVRLAGIEVSNRIGLDTLFMSQLPKDKTMAAMSEWVGNMVLGAPGTMIANGFAAFGAMMGGDFPEALQKAPLPKFATDLVRAMRGYSEGKISKTGMPLMEPYDPGEALARALGFQPRREARSWEVGAAAANKEQKAATAQGNSLKNQWARAETVAERARIWEKIKAFNESAKDSKDFNPITMATLHKYKAGLAKRVTERRQELREYDEEFDEG